MAYVNVKDWSVDQVTDWIKGLDNAILQYASAFLNNLVTGNQLLNLRADDLEHLGIKIVGHQEIILEAVEHLRSFHYDLDKENLQMLALRLSCAANSLYKELVSVDDDLRVVPTQTLSDVHNIIATIKPLVCWLDRSPFVGDKDYVETKHCLLELAFEMATSAHRDIFSENPVLNIRRNCAALTQIADHIIQEISDPMILQPAFLDLAALKKKEQMLGFIILPNNHAVHQIAEIKYGSPAHGSAKIEEGDEIVQVNYQTVVGWQRKKVMHLVQDSPADIVLTLKKRPRHTKVYGQIYMKPYKLPSKRSDGLFLSRWNDNIPSPALILNNLPPIQIPEAPPINSFPEIETHHDADLDLSDEPLESSLGDIRIYPIKPRPILQRRNSFTGSIQNSKVPYPKLEECVQLLKKQADLRQSSAYESSTNKFETQDSHILRDKSASCMFDGELSNRPTTVIGISSQNHHHHHSRPPSLRKRRVNFDDSKLEEKSVSVNSLASLKSENIAYIDEGRELTDRTSMTIIDEPPVPLIDNQPKDVILKEVNIQDIIKRFDEYENKPKVYPRSNIKKTPPEVPQKPDSTKKPMIPPRNPTKIRGRLDKSHSTPAYDLTEEDAQQQPPSPADMFGVPCLNLELGIPVVKEEEKRVEVEIRKEEKKDLPPKPPPRTFGLIDVNKPAYPSDSPKPTNVNVGPEITRPAVVKNSTVFEFPVDNRVKLDEDMKKNVEEKNFEPKLSSTPLTKGKTDFGDGETNNYRATPTLSVETVSRAPDKILQSNSIMKAMMYSNKNKSGKKKNSLTAKRRKVTVNDLNPADLQGYLYQRIRSKHNQNIHWEKRWFVLLGSCLYGFKTKDDSKASCLIFLSGFTAAIANEVKSRSNAFKVYHTGTVFYFSTDDQEALQSWIEMITAATLNSDQSKHADSSLYSETDESDSEKSHLTPTGASSPKTPSEKSSDALKKFGSLKKFTSKRSDTTTPPQSGSTSLDRKWLFMKSSHSKHALPVPTPKFQTYRKVKTVELTGSVTTGNFTSHVPCFAPRSEIQTLSQMQQQNVSVPNLSDDNLLKNKKSKNKPTNYVHASHPSLTEDFTPAKPIKKENLVGFVTLEELMIRQAEERRTNPHNMFEEDFSLNLNSIKPDVVYGEVPIRPKCADETQEVEKRLNKTDTSSSCFGKRLGSVKKAQTDYKTANQKNRSLPRSINRNQKSDPRYASDRNLTDFKERSYEMIYCPEITTDVQFAQNRQLDLETPKKNPAKLKKQHSFNGKSLGSAKYTNKVSDSSKIKLKSAIQYTPMALPLATDPKPRPKLAFELNLDEKAGGKSSKFKLFGKPNENPTKKEKTFLGSPKLHRAIFRKHQQTGSDWSNGANQTLSTNPSAYPLENQSNSEPAAIAINVSPHADYPGLKYPPVFEPETYSLADPQSSLTLLKKQARNN